MHSTDTKNCFIKLRAQGWSLARIAAHLDVAKRTLVDWNQHAQAEIRALKAVEKSAPTSPNSLPPWPPPAPGARRKTAPFLHHFCTKNSVLPKPIPVAQQVAIGPLQDGAIMRPAYWTRRKREFGKEKVKKW
jgi:hypothetical protein